MPQHSSLAVADYILNRAKETRNNTLTPLQIIKLVYMSHGWMLGWHGRPLLQEEIEAWQYGPVIPKLYDAVREFGSMPVEGPLSKNKEEFDEDEKNIMDQVADVYGKFSGIKLSSITHREGTPWHSTWHHQGRSGVISNDLIEDYYQRLYRESTSSTQS